MRFNLVNVLAVAAGLGVLYVIADLYLNLYNGIVAALRAAVG